MLTDQAGAKTWPITGATFILVHKKQSKPELAGEALKFFDWAYRHGDRLAQELHYVPMPQSVVTLVENTWKKEIVDSAGKSVWTDSMIQK